MATEYILTNIGRPLNGDNFSAWKLRITSILTALNLREYLDRNITPEGIQNPEVVRKINQENAAAVSIMLNNIEDKIYPLLTETNSAFNLMENLKILFEKDEDVTLQEWLEKLRQLKAKSNKDILSVTSKMMTTFRQMEKKNLPITEQEKIDYLLGCMPRELRLVFISGSITTANELFEDIKKKYKLLNHIGKPKERNYKAPEEDMMDIDLVDNIFNINKNPKNFKQNKYCHICHNTSHNTEDCYYNLKNKNNNNNNNAGNYKKPKHNNKRKNKKGNYLGFLNNGECDEVLSLSGDEVFLINNIKEGSEKKCDNKSSENTDVTSWIYDTGASEHITNNKNILKKFCRQSRQNEMCQ